MQALIRRCHESPSVKKGLRNRAWQLFRSLVDRKIVEFMPRTPEGAHVRVNVTLPDDFSLNQVLSLYLLDTIQLLDREAPDYALDVITLVESILEDPDLILRRQLDKVKDQKMAEWKASGMEYNERMDELEKLEYPKPKREFVYDTFNAFSEKHPWVGKENIRPKSIAREMFESYRSFSDYIKIYDLHRVEGLLLRHLMGVWKVLRQTVPPEAKTESVQEMEEYLGTMLRQIDSSLLDEWEKMRNPDYRPTAVQSEVRPPGAEEAAKDVTRDELAFTASIRAKVFVFLRALANDDFPEAIAALSTPARSEGESWTPELLRVAVEPFYADHQWICMDPEARNRRHTHVVKSEDRKSWTLEQIWVDPEQKNDWSAVFGIDLDASRAASAPVLALVRVGTVGR